MGQRLLPHASRNFIEGEFGADDCIRIMDEGKADSMTNRKELMTGAIGLANCDNRIVGKPIVSVPIAMAIANSMTMGYGLHGETRGRHMAVFEEVLNAAIRSQDESG